MGIKKPISTDFASETTKTQPTFPSMFECDQNLASVGHRMIEDNLFDERKGSIETNSKPERLALILSSFAPICFLLNALDFVALPSNREWVVAATIATLMTTSTVGAILGYCSVSRKSSLGGYAFVLGLGMLSVMGAMVLIAFSGFGPS